LPRLTFTLDENTADEVERLKERSTDLAGRVKRFFERSGPEQWERLEPMARSLAKLGEDPSLAGIIREALFYYFASLDEILERARTEAGYAALAADEERAEALFSARDRVAQDWADEP
jgi:hypothetical protein